VNVDDLMKAVNESYAKNANVKIVFGEPIEKEGITVVPVAKVAGKVGEGNSFHIRIGSPNYKGKENSPPSENEQTEEKKIEKGGYGIETKLTPMGFIEIKNGKAEFKPILDISRLAMMGICFAGFSVFLMTRMITRVTRILSKPKCKCDGKCDCKEKECTDQK
jgi:uncharacterized spore protein YtfJ